ncbi:hypothetical protein Q3V23_31045 [Streptomyces sp. VNUA116]|uniref:hypothetical protein n=1 Tax=Streptomyces sp. VNUA116 TaxID=3062449 RepID=UPI002676C534|nr:hypothetical protein [Streptomyces sp. VNUA116]WKU48136.1 hypothetical protein Q3V23_31045 [Streptomyces sp. VNUA116]
MIAFIADLAARPTPARRPLMIADALLPVTLGLFGNSLNIGWFVWALTGIVAWQASHALTARS